MINIGNVRRVKAIAADLLPYKEKYEIYLRCLENEKAALLQLRSPDALPEAQGTLTYSFRNEAIRVAGVDKRAVDSN